jgi:hypothetical protein
MFIAKQQILLLLFKPSSFCELRDSPPRDDPPFTGISDREMLHLRISLSLRANNLPAYAIFPRAENL